MTNKDKLIATLAGLMEDSVEEATALRQSAKLSNGSVVRRSRKSGESSYFLDNDKASRRIAQKTKKKLGKTYSVTDNPAKGVNAQNAGSSRRTPNRHARKRMGEAYEEAFYEGKGWRAALGDRSLRSKRGKQEVLRSRKSGERDSYSDNKQFDRDRNWGKWSKTKSDFSANRTRRDKNDYENNVNSQNSSAPRSKPNRHDRKRMGEEAELEEMKAFRGKLKHDVNKTVWRSRKSGEHLPGADNTKQGKKSNSEHQKYTGSKRGESDHFATERVRRYGQADGINAQRAEGPRRKPNRHQRKRMGEDQELEEMRAFRGKAEGLGTKRIQRSRKSGERIRTLDNDREGKRYSSSHKKEHGKKISRDDYRSVNSQNADRARVWPNRHARKRLGQAYEEANIQLGQAIAEGLGLRAVLAKAKERYTKGSKASQAKGIAKANKEAEQRTAAREKKERGDAYSKNS